MASVDGDVGRVVVVGTGIAGVSAAAAVRQTDPDREIVLLGAEPELPYRRPPLSKEVLRGDKSIDEIRIKKAEWYADNRIDLRTGVRVSDVDAAASTVTLDDRTQLTYGALLLATGGIPRDLGGDHRIGPRVRTVRAVSDIGPLRAELARTGSVLIVGAGLIGSELAASARQMGCRVTMLETAAVPLAQLVPTSVGRRYGDLHVSEGVRLETNVQIESVTESDPGDEVAVRSRDGREWSAPLVVLAVGMEPSTELARRAGARIASAHDGGGVVVDSHGATSVPGIFAAGDVANWPSPLGGRMRVEHWQGAQNQGTAVGKTIAGRATAYREVPWCWSDQYGHTLQVIGWPDSADDVDIEGSLYDLDFIARYSRSGEVVGAVSIGRPAEIRATRKDIATRLAL